MPKTHRDLYRRNLAQSYINIDYAGAYLFELYKLFNPVHPELGALLQGAMEGLTVTQEILTEFAFRSWGKDTPDWQAWAATGYPRHDIEKATLPENAPTDINSDVPLSNEDNKDGT